MPLPARIASSFLTLVILLPAVAQAHFLPILEETQLAIAGNRLYRQVEPARPWQLAEIEGIKDQLVANGVVYLINNNGQIFRSQDGLRTEQLDLTVTTSSRFMSIEGRYFLWTGPDNPQIYQLLNGHWHETLNAPPLTNEEDFMQFTGKPSIAVRRSSSTDIYHLKEDTWESALSVPCLAYRLFEVKVPVVWCEGGEVLSLVNSTWQKVFESRVLHVLSGDVLTAQAEESRYIYIFDGQDSRTFLLEDDVALLTISKRRILLSVLGGGVAEMMWERLSPAMEIVSTDPEAKVVTLGGGEGIFISESDKALLSYASGTWQLVPSAGRFNRAEKVGLEVVVWKTDPQTGKGGLMMRFVSEELGFQKVNPWSSTTSPIQATQLTRSPYLVLVRTNSGQGSFNLYRSEDMASWSRTTLPKQPTLVRGVAQIRSLGAGTLVETEGIVSVSPGEIAADLAYLQDEDAGIQLYLSQSKGEIKVSRGQEVRVSGEISSAATRRILLDSPENIKIVGTDNLVLQEIAVDNVGKFLGSYGWFRGEVSDVSSKDISLGEVRVKFLSGLTSSLKETFRLKDSVRLRGVADWNASSKKVEVTYLGGGYEYLSRAVVIEENKNEGSDSGKTVVAAKSSTTPSLSHDSDRSEKASSASKPTQSVQPKPTPTKSVPTQVAGISTDNPLTITDGAEVAENWGNSAEHYTLLLLSLLTGMLVMRGFSLRQRYY